MPRFVLEIGTEELPPRFFPPALSQLREQGEAMLHRLRLSYDKKPRVYGTPRRLALVVEGVAAQQAAAVREERGPSAKVAFDAEGKPTKAAEGFARRHGVLAADLVRRETDQGEYVFAIVHDPEAPAAQALASACPDLITGLSFPKSMRWGTTSLRFGRPVRWVLALLDEEVVEFELNGIRSGRLIRGHPVLDDGMHPVSHATQYEDTLREHSVIISPTEREERLWAQLRRLTEAENADVVGWGWPFAYGREQLSLDEIVQGAGRFDLEMKTSFSAHTVFLVEYPTAALGRFDPSFLALPEPVLEAEIKDVQSYFPLARLPADEEAPRELLPCFIGVRDGGEEHLDKIAAGWESVLRAKLIDAKFFYEQDLKKSLADRVEALKGVVFQEKLGTMYDKVERVRAIAADLAGQMHLDESRTRSLDRAALLCKADLTTEVVTELSDLQGVMGREYATFHGEPKEVADAIGEHYMPRYAGGDAPSTSLSTLLAIADKLDTITACFAVGIVPSGSADPFGLRREGTGAVRCFVEWPPNHALIPGLLRVSAGQLVEVCVKHLRESVSQDLSDEQMATRVSEFLAQRLEVYLRDKGVRYDLAQAALAVRPDRLLEVHRRAHALRQVLDDPAFLPTVMAATRVANIVKGFAGGEVSADLFRDPAESALWSAYQEVLPQAEAQSRAGDYEALFWALATLREPIDRYFEEVLVMAEEEAIRANRLATVSAVNELFRELADLSLVVQS